MKVKELLGNVKVSKGVQNAGNQIVIPLIAEEELTDVSSDMLVEIAHDTDYAKLSLQNKDEGKPVIIPQGTAFISKKAGQDRATLKVNVVDCQKYKTVDVACIQSSESSHFEKGMDEFTFIPTSIREKAMEKHKDGPGHSNYSMLWDDISSYMKKLGMEGQRSHIHDFYDYFKKELDEFIAPFEKVSNQVGAIILINNKVVGIELYPNYGSWSKVWRKLIRDSYGAEAVGLIKQKKTVGFKPYIEADNITTIADLKAEVDNVKKVSMEFIMEKVNPILEKTVESEQTSVSVNFKINTLKVSGFVGQSVEKDGKLYYLSLFRGMVK